jgi:hypothetical protein
MKWFQGTFTQRVNVKRKAPGHLFQGRYKALLVEADEKSYFSTAAEYIHLNPVRAGLAGKKPGDIRDYDWSSFPDYLSSPKRRPPWLCVSKLFWALGFKDRPAGRRRFEAYMEERSSLWRTGEGRQFLDKGWKDFRRGWYAGGDRFRDALLGLLEESLAGRRRDSFSGEAVRTHDQGEAERLVENGMKLLGLDDDALAQLPKSAPEKAALAWLVRKKTMVPNRWVAERLSSGHPGRIPAMTKEIREARSGSLASLRKQMEKLR